MKDMENKDTKTPSVRKAVAMAMLGILAVCAIATFAGAVDNSAWYLIPGIPTLSICAWDVVKAWRNTGI